jgi:hypothetical protein
MKGESIIGIPKENRAVSDAAGVQPIMESAHRFGRMPLLPQHNGHFALGSCRVDESLRYEAWNGFVEIE